MNQQDLVSSRRAALESAIVASAGDKVHLDALAGRLLGHDRISALTPGFAFSCPDEPEVVRCEGFPRIAHIGFGLGSGALDPLDVSDIFLGAVGRLRQRQGQMLQSLKGDDVALLGIAEGVDCLRKAGVSVPKDMSEWLVHLIDSEPGRDHWLSRIRSLAGDMLDGRGRIWAAPKAVDTDSAALEFTLRATWSKRFSVSHGIDDEGRAQLLANLLADHAPQSGDIVRAVIWLRAIDILVTLAAHSLTRSVSDTVRLLQDVQHSLKRWRSDSRDRREKVRQGTWLIDDEYDVQTLLWAVLYPTFGPDLVDESYLPNWGFTAPRLDLGIESLRIIIEVKIARIPSDFKEIEGEVHADLGLYFKDPSKFDRMIVFIYDDCDKHVPEKIDGLKNALRKRDRIEDVVVVRRPSVMPARNMRGPIQNAARANGN